jgi:hypothetical protein
MLKLDVYERALRRIAEGGGTDAYAARGALRYAAAVWLIMG